MLDNPGLIGGAVETWDVRTRRRVRALQFPKTPSIARFSPDGKLVAVGNGTGQTRVYETATFKPVTRVLAGEAGGIVGAAITPDNRTLATGSATGAVQLWDIRSGQALGAPLPGVPLERRDPRLHARRQPPRRDLRQRPRVRVGHPARLADPPGLPRWPAGASPAPSGPSSCPGAPTTPAC